MNLKLLLSTAVSPVSTECVEKHELLSLPLCPLIRWFDLRDFLQGQCMLLCSLYNIMSMHIISVVFDLHIEFSWHIQWERQHIDIMLYTKQYALTVRVMLYCIHHWLYNLIIRLTLPVTVLCFTWNRYSPSRFPALHCTACLYWCINCN